MFAVILICGIYIWMLFEGSVFAQWLLNWIGSSCVGFKVTFVFVKN